MSYLKVSIGIFIALAASRFIPHPPNFPSLIALSFYVPAILGIRYLPALVLSFVITDFFVGFHSLSIFTWGSVVLISLISKYLENSLVKRIAGALLGAIVFFVVTNFGVWCEGSYGYTYEGLITCYLLALPFFGNMLVSTFLFSSIIELFFLKRSVIKNYITKIYIQ